ncbi:MAG TPA: hypothetical protein VGE52_05825, partial [Pirellulales bacterium]
MNVSPESVDPHAKILARLESAGDEAASDDQAARRCRIEVRDAALLGRKATYTLSRIAETRRTNGTTASEELFRWTGRLDEPNFTVPLTPSALDAAYIYSGVHTAVRLESRIVVDDGIFSDTTHVYRESRALPARQGGQGDAESLINPSDQYDVLRNFSALPFHRKLIVAGLFVVALMIAGVNSLIGLHDEFAPRGGALVYPQLNSKGKRASPFLESLAVSGGAGAVVVLAIMTQMRGYMSFRLKSKKLEIHPDLRLPIRELITGRSRVPLEEVVLRVVAANTECGSFKVRRKKTTTTRSFKTPCRAIVLFEQSVAYIPAHEPIESAFTGEVDFGPLFAA